MKSAFIPMVLMAPWILVILGIIYGKRSLLKRRRLRTPLTRNLLRLPGESLRTQIDELGKNISTYMLFMMLVPFIVYSIHIPQSYFGGAAENLFRIAISVVLCLGFLVFFTYNLVRAMNLCQRPRLDQRCRDVEPKAYQLQPPRL